MASSQFVTHSQPTLSAVWKKPAADLKRSQRPPPARTGANTIAPAEPAPACVVQSAQEGFVLPFSPAVSPPKPGEVCTAPLIELILVWPLPGTIQGAGRHQMTCMLTGWMHADTG